MVDPTRPTVSLEVAQHVLWHFGDTNLGLQPGSFTERLMVTCSAADPGNLAKLEEAFPELVYAWRCASREHWGLEWLRSKVKRGLVPDREVDLFESAAQSSSSHECAPFGGGDECLGCLQDEDAERMRSDNAVQS